MSCPWKKLKAPERDIDVILAFLKGLGVTCIYEFGCGRSTERFAMDGVDVVSFETCPGYAADSQAYFESQGLDPMPRVVTYKYDREFVRSASDMPGRPVCFVDGPRGEKKQSRLLSLRAAARLSPIILLHDAQRPGEKDSLAYMAGKGWRVEYLPGAEKPEKIAVLRGS
jgi:hypothetical protein